MNNQPEQVQFDERVDLYLRGKMSEDEELAFEVEYLDNPDLLAQVEMVEKLIHGLKLNEQALGQAAQVNEANTAYQVHKPSQPADQTGLLVKIKQWLSDWFTAQTAWGAVAATVLLVPLMSMIDNSGTSYGGPDAQGTYVHLLGHRVRSASQAADTIIVEPEQTNLVVGFSTASTFGVPEPLTITVYNSDNNIIWQQQGLLPDYRWTVYLSINAQTIEPGEYRYELTNGESIVNSGRFDMQFDNGGH